MGHNGAGKTTLFNMLTGMTTPTRGSAFLYGYDLRYVLTQIISAFFFYKTSLVTLNIINFELSDSNQLEEIRRMTGVCPQHDVLFDQLTPREHLAFYAKIRVRTSML